MSRGFDSILGSDLYRLAQEQPQELVAVEALANATRAPNSGMAYRLDFDDGSSLKGRRLFSEVHARRVEYWIGVLQDSMLPRVRGRRGAALILDWIVGEPPLRPAGFDPLVHGVCADFQARLHQWYDSKIETTPPRFSGEQLADRLRDGIRVLEDHRLLSASEVAALRRIVEEPALRPLALALVHDDLCGENLVIDRQGDVRIIDNEGLRVGYVGHDLARSVYRWEMDAEVEARYLARYEQTGSAAPFRSDRAFWMAVVLVESARHRASASQAHRQIPLDRLRQELRNGLQGQALG